MTVEDIVNLVISKENKQQSGNENAETENVT